MFVREYFSLLPVTDSAGRLRQPIPVRLYDTTTALVNGRLRDVEPVAVRPTAWQSGDQDVYPVVVVDTDTVTDPLTGRARDILPVRVTSGSLGFYNGWGLAFDFVNGLYRVGVGNAGRTNWLGEAGVTYTRTGADLLSYNPSTGKWAAYAAGVPPIMPQGGQDVPEGTTNKCTNYNAAPPALIASSDAATFNAAVVNMQASGPASARYSVVDDTARLRASGFGDLIDAGKLNGRVYCIDNSLGATGAQVLCYSTATTLIPVSVSVFAAGGSGTTGMHLGADPNASFAASSLYKRTVATGTPTNTGAAPRVVADPGQVVYFILNQYEDKAYATNPVIVSGASATRGNAQPVITGLASILTPPFTLVAVANLSAIDGVNRYTVTASAAGSSNDRLRMLRSPANVADIASVRSGVSTSLFAGTGYTGPRLMKQAIRVRSLDEMGSIDGKLGSAVSVSPPIGLDRLDLGVANGALSGFLNSPLLFVGIAPDLTDAQLQAITASNGALADFL